jgi:hypothetical protein
MNRMCTTNEAKQQRQNDPHIWHLDGHGATTEKELLTVVLILFEEELDWESLGSSHQQARRWSVH